MSAISSSDNSKMSSAAKSASKATKTATATPAAAAPAAAAPATKTSKAAAKATPEPVAAAAPVVEAAPATKTRGKKAAAPAASPSTAAPVATETPAAAPVAEEDLATKLANALKRQGEIAHQQKQLAVEAASNAKEIEKLAGRVAKKAAGRRKRTEGSNSKSGMAFKTPVPITSELSAFLGLEKGALISRGEVSSRMYAYFRAHGLQAGKVINTDASLRKLLCVTEKDEVTILNLQKYINKHFVKPTPAAAN
jgi:hypothetical protein